jgi:CheY-like chemotaxis protein
MCPINFRSIDGIETTKTILKVVDECLQVGVAIKVPAIICLTANAEIETRTRCLNAGMIDFLTKPVTIKDLQTALMNA